MKVHAAVSNQMSCNAGFNGVVRNEVGSEQLDKERKGLKGRNSLAQAARPGL